MQWNRLAILLLAAAALLRFALVGLPELGRDEVTYLYWTWHPQPDYAPLLQLQILLARLVSVEPWFLRLGQLGIGAGILGMFYAWLRARGDSHPLWSTAALATTPWLCFSGSILHPDGLFVLGLVGFALAMEKRHAWGVVAGALLCVGAKLSGLLPAAVALFWLARRRDIVPAVTLGLILALGLSGLERSTLTAVRGFARVDASPPARLLLLGLELLLLAPVLAGVARYRRGLLPLTGAGLVAVFVFAAVAGGQVKANWLLPGLILLWPRQPRRHLTAGLGLVGLALSFLMVTGYLRPNTAGEAERWLGQRGLLPEYLSLAGEREARVASAQSWREYLEGFHGSLEWPDLPARPDQIVSDDYAIAARLALLCPAPVPTVVVPGDPLFGGRPAAMRLVVAVRTDPARLVATSAVQWQGALAHPVTGEPILLLLLEGYP